MFKKPLYDVAISVAEQDLGVANQIAASCQAKNISYYLYNEQRADAWGKHILEISLNKFGADAKYMLVIISKNSVDRYWMSIESQIARVFRHGKEPYILPVRIDDTPVDGLSKYVVFMKWENNPDEIADKILEKLNKRKKKKKRTVRVAVSFSIPVVSLLVYLSTLMQPGGPGKSTITDSTRSDTQPAAYTKNENLPDTTGTKQQPDNSKSTVHEEKKQRSIPRKESREFIIEGYLKDWETGELLDNVKVNINGQQTLTKNGWYKLALPLQDLHVNGYHLPLRYQFSKAGYDAQDYNENLVLGNELTKQTDVNLIRSK